MKTFVVSAVSIVLVSIFFSPMVMSAPSMPDDLQMVQPDPSLPKELSAFFGKWEGTSSNFMLEYFLIVEKIDEEKASLYIWVVIIDRSYAGWERYEAKVIKERGKYKLWYIGRFGNDELTLKGEYLISSSTLRSSQLRRVP
jgi:hypothetical protein